MSVHLDAARQYRLYVDDSRQRTLALNEVPLFVWTNPRRAGGQVGHLFVWMNGEFPGAVATFFSFPWAGDHTRQRLVHELHSLMQTRLVSANDAATQEWKPTSGIRFYPLNSRSATPDDLARRRLRIRQLSRLFQAHTIDQQQQRWPLEINSRELLAYGSEDRTGAMFAMLGDAGADPELLLLIEAKREGKDWNWRYAPVRMTDQEIYLSIDRREVWTSIHDEATTRFYNADHTYFRFLDRFYDPSTLPRSATPAE